MNNKEKYIEKTQKQMEKYHEKIAKVDDLLKNAKAGSKPALLSQRDRLQDKLKEGEKMLQNLQYSSEEEYEKIKDTVIEVFDDIQEAFYELSHFLTFEQLHHAKDEVVEFGSEKIDEVQDLIKRHPLTTATCAMGLGFLVGSLITRSK